MIENKLSLILNIVAIVLNLFPLVLRNMCGILAVLSQTGEIKISKRFGNRVSTSRQITYRQSAKQRHRGPDHTGIADLPEHGVSFAQERLAVVCPATGDQPLKSDDGNIILAANGEIYNYLELSAEIAKKKGKYTPRSDCDVIIGMYEEFGSELVSHITGMFAFVLYDKVTKNFIAARDPIGIIPLYQGEDDEGNLWFASEMKCLVGICDKIVDFQPGTMLFGQPRDLKVTQYYQPQWISELPSSKADLTLLRQQLESAVRSHLQADAPYGALLSGGVDSSLIASIATKILRERDPKYRLKTYSVGLENAPDFKYSRMVADYINSDHKEVLFQVEDALDIIRETIYHLESYDISTVRCSIPMVLLSRYVKSEGLKMVLSGEGSDEIFGGYLYFFQAPNKIEFYKETVERVLTLHKFDILRANKATMANGVELRVPFLDTAFINHSMNIRPEDKLPGPNNEFGCEEGETTTRMEKHILRAAFADNYLPDEVLWRQKEQFSEGVGYSFLDVLCKYASEQISDEEFATAAEIYPINTPLTKEVFYYRVLFEEMFPGDECARTVPNWIPREDWGCNRDPSGRAQKAHFNTRFK